MLTPKGTLVGGWWVVVIEVVRAVELNLQLQNGREIFGVVPHWVPSRGFGAAASVPAGRLKACVGDFGRAS